MFNRLPRLSWFTTAARVSGFTFTFVSIHFSNTRRIVKTRITCAFVYICDITINSYRLLKINTFSILQEFKAELLRATHTLERIQCNVLNFQFNFCYGIWGFIQLAYEYMNGDTKCNSQITLAVFYIFYIMTARCNFFNCVLIRVLVLRIFQ